MSLLSKNSAYTRYLAEVENSGLELPEYTTDEDGNARLYYGEVFCRVRDCGKAGHRFTLSSNLRDHIVRHEDMNLAMEVGGKPSNKKVMEAGKWYRELFAEVDAAKEREKERRKVAIRAAATKATPEPVSSAYDPETPLSMRAPLPSIPLNKAGTVHITKMRKAVKDKNLAIPCDKCPTAKDCCKDIKICEHFYLFDCDVLEGGQLAGGNGTEEIDEV
ncbi:uncharacterized protein BDV14DRAFT_186357 [Aspergillus stella-maris]|uniref:uncharacterized protein n=1 Tax=Aspergillus stella-maris TaxID=1810926 RepID=UPI003CCDAA9A